MAGKFIKIDFNPVLQSVKEEGNPELILDQVEIRTVGVPNTWLPVLESKKPCKHIHQIWSSLAVYMPLTIYQLNRKLQAVSLLRTKTTGISLIYAFKSQGELYFYRGFAPDVYFDNSNLLIKKLPDNFNEFYMVHNGWESCGYSGAELYPHSRCHFLKEYVESDYLKDKHIRNNLDRFYVIAEFYSFIYVGFDFSSNSAASYSINIEGDVQLSINIFRTIDSLTSEILEQMDDAE